MRDAPDLSKLLDERMIERVQTIPTGHPSLPGHFPGRPIVPAVVILDEVRALIADAYPDRQITAIDHCKFQDFVLPDQSFRMALTVKADTAIDFTCTSAEDGRLLVKGRFRFEAAGIG